jgi:hypothetical protein
VVVPVCVCVCMGGEVRARVCARVRLSVCVLVRMSELARVCVCESYRILHAAVCYQVNTHTVWSITIWIQQNTDGNTCLLTHPLSHSTYLHTYILRETRRYEALPVKAVLSPLGKSNILLYYAVFEHSSTLISVKITTI